MVSMHEHLHFMMSPTFDINRAYTAQIPDLHILLLTNTQKHLSGRISALIASINHCSEATTQLGSPCGCYHQHCLTF